MVLISLRNLKKSYDSQPHRIEVLTGVDFDIDKGETLAIVGASGIGKSTLLNIIGTLDRPDAGELYFGNDNVFRYTDQQLARFRNRTMGFVFQFHYLLPEFSALENVIMPCLIQGMARNEAGRLAAAILTRVGLEARLNQRIGELSGGEQQRVALARALVLNPTVLLADEPTGNLDRGNSGRIHDMLLELNRELHMTVLVVTHNPELADCMQRRVTIRDGRLVEMKKGEWHV